MAQMTRWNLGRNMAVPCPKAGRKVAKLMLPSTTSSWILSSYTIHRILCHENVSLSLLIGPWPTSLAFLARRSPASKSQIIVIKETIIIKWNNNIKACHSKTSYRKIHKARNERFNSKGRRLRTRDCNKDLETCPCSTSIARTIRLRHSNTTRVWSMAKASASISLEIKVVLLNQ